MKFITHLPRLKQINMDLIIRILLAVFGGYGVAVLVDLAFLGLPIHPLSAVFLGQIASLITFTSMILLTFSIYRLKKLCVIFTCIVISLAMIDYMILR